MFDFGEDWRSKKSFSFACVNIVPIEVYCIFIYRIAIIKCSLLANQDDNLFKIPKIYSILLEIMQMSHIPLINFLCTPSGNKIEWTKRPASERKKKKEAHRLQQPKI